MNDRNKPDIAVFDFTSIKKAEHAARIVERKGSKLLVGLVGDSLLEVRKTAGSTFLGPVDCRLSHEKECRAIFYGHW